MVLKQKKISLKKPRSVSLNQSEQEQVAGGAAVRSYAFPCYTIIKCIAK